MNFPFSSFDPTPYLASVPQETILRHKELLEQKQQAALKNIRNHDCNDEIVEFDLENNIGSSDEIHRMCDSILENSSEENYDGESSTQNDCNNVASSSSKNTSAARKSVHSTTTPTTINKQNSKRRERLVSTSLTKTPIIDGQFVDYNNHNLKSNQDPFDVKYSLYAVVVSSFDLSPHLNSHSNFFHLSTFSRILVFSTEATT